MKNINDLVNTLISHKMFVTIDEKLLLKLKKKKLIAGYRNH